MKKIFAIGLVLCASTLIGAIQGNHQLTINGNVLGNMVVLPNGEWAVRLDDVARALGAPLTLEPGLKIRGDHLIVTNASDVLKVKIETAHKHNVAAGQFLVVRKAGEIGRIITDQQGTKWIPVRELVRAFGDGSVRGTFSGGLKPGENINLNLRQNSNGIIAVLIGL